MKRLIPILLWLGALLLIAFALLRYESDLLWKVQQYNLFLDTSLFFSEKMVVPGGLLVYSTCSNEPEENADRVAAFLASHPDFAEVTRRESLPHESGHDGAFACALVRRGRT